MIHPTMITRRTLLGTAGLLVTVRARADEQGGAPPAKAPLPGSLRETPTLDAWIRVAPDGAVTAFTGKAELGQGLRTALLQVAAEELRIAPTQLTLVTADTGRTANEGFTAGSHSMQDSGTALLHAAANVRALLTEAAAVTWSLPADRLTARDAAIHAPDGRTLPYATLAARLDLHVEARPDAPLVAPAAYTLIGTSLPRVDIPAKLTGGEAYIQDLRLPGMLHARIVRQPSPGATLQDLDPTPIERLPGVVRVLRDGSWLAVVAEREWQAVKAHRALAALARWTPGPPLPDPDAILDTIRALPARDIPVLAWANPAPPPARRLRARYTRQYLMHAAIGPSCAIARLDDTLTVWSHTQGVYPLRAALASLLGLPNETVRVIHSPGAGCYGHNGADDVAGDAALVARALAQTHPGRPVRVQWMREDENTSEPYSPAMIVEAEAALSAPGPDGTARIVDWDYGVWSNTHNRRPNVGGLMLQNGALSNRMPVPPPAPIPMPEGGGERNSNPIYALPNARVVSHFIPEMPLRVSAQRSLGAHVNVFAIESFMDELAEAAGADPVAFRLAHLDDPRARAVVALAADRYGWPGPEKGRGFAFARYKNLGAYCAVALDLQVEHETGAVRLGRIVAAVDSGQPISPDGIRNQIEGAILQSASWSLHEQVRFDRSRITSIDWSAYPILRFPAVPASIEVHIVPSPGLPFLGTGEAGQGPTAAAIANAIRAATGQRLRDLPLTQAKLKHAIGV